MKLKIRNYIFVLSMGVIILLGSCNGDNTSNNTNKDTILTKNTNEDINKPVYLIPSPEDMFAFTKFGKLTFMPKLLNPTENSEKYIDTKSREFNFGVYSADLAYSAAFAKHHETVKYLKTVQNISDQIGIATVFNQSMISRIDNIIENKDSLIQLSSDTYYDIVKFLEKNNRKRTLALIATGGWLESLFIVTNSIDKYSEKDPIIQLIADQKIIFSNLMLYLEQNQDDETIKSLLTDLSSIKAVFDKLEVVKVEVTKNTDENKIVVGGNSKITINEQQFNELKTALTTVRNNITNNNVK